MALQVPLAEAGELVQRQIERGEEISQRGPGPLPIWGQKALDAIWADWRTWREYTEDLLKRIFSNGDIAAEFVGELAPVGLFDSSIEEELKWFRLSAEEDLRKLKSIKSRMTLYVDAEAQVLAAGAGRATASRRVFIVHGRDAGAQNAVARLVQTVGLEAVVLQEQPNGGSRALLGKLMAIGDTAGYAVVVLTADDVGALATDLDQLRPRARQNVVLELGYFLGRLGPDRVCALTEGGIEVPSDYGGIVYIPYDEGGAWRYALAKELRLVWGDVDLNAV